jgi:hypothetical protein
MNKFLSVSFFILVFSSCAQDPSSSDTVQEKTTSGSLNKSTFIIDTVLPSGPPWQYGFVLQALKQGTINAVGVVIPASGNFTVQIYRMTNPAIPIHTQVVECPIANAPCFENLDGGLKIDVAINESMGLTVIANSYYRVSSAFGGPIPFPIQSDSGLMKITSFYRDSSKLNAFPTNKPLTTFMSPCVDIIFSAKK